MRRVSVQLQGGCSGKGKEEWGDAPQVE